MTNDNRVERMPNNIPPFVKFCCANVPAVFDDSLSYYEALCALWKYLQDCIDVINNNALLEEEYIEKFNELKSYVENYFDNLDVQDEINNKLDAMAASGELGEYFERFVTPALQAMDNKIDSNNTAINAKVDNNQAITNERINNLVEGGIVPIPVASTGSMTDHDRIYVNTTDGKWYYWNGSAWTAGGTYQSAVDPTDVEGLTYNLIHEDLKYLLGWVVGNINSVNGELLIGPLQNHNIITYDIQKYDYDLYIPYNSYCRTDLFFYNPDDSYSTWMIVANNTRGWKIPAGQKFRIRLTYNVTPDPNPDLTEDDATNSLLFLNYNIMSHYDYRRSQLNKLENDGYPVDPENLKYSIEMGIGEIGLAGFYWAVNNNYRIITYDFLCYDFDVVIPKSSDFDVYLWEYTDRSGSNPTGRGWLPISSGDYTIAAGKIFRLVICTSRNSTTALLNVYDNNAFKAFSMFKLEDVNALKRYNNEMRSVAHQGYSPESGEIGHCKLEAYTAAKKHGFDYGECDIAWTSDGIPVCSHDASFVSGGVTIVISEHTFEELQAYDFYGGTIASFEQVVQKCKELGLGLYIDHVYGSWIDTSFQKIFNIVKQFGMTDHVTWLLLPTETYFNNVYNKIITFNKKARILLLTSSYSDFINAITKANNLSDDYNKIGIDFNVSNVGIDELAAATVTANSGIEFETWTIDNAEAYKSYLPFVSGITSNKVCYNDVYADLI